MTKILPINSIKINNLKPECKKCLEKIISSPYKMTEASAIGATGVILSTFLKDFDNSVKDNYFKFKINPETQNPYEPDIFQKAAGMNLALGNDVLVTAPTGTGKTAIAEYIITKNLKEGHRTFYTTPLKALSNEKFLDFSNTYGKENVGLITGDTKINTDAPIIVMTTEVYRNMASSEKFNFDPDKKVGIPKSLKTVIFDELQYLGDVDRGGIWEQAIMFTPKNVQMLSLSATIKNNEEINNWMAFTKGRKNAISITPDDSYKTVNDGIKRTVLVNVPPENRHVPLKFEIENVAAAIKESRSKSKVDKIIAKKEGARIAQSIYAKPNDDAYLNITKKLRYEGKLPAIYFVFSKRKGKQLAKYLSQEGEVLTTKEEQKQILEIIEKYKNENIYLGETLNIKTILNGYAVHNAGLLPSQKRLIEELFQKKLVKVVIATETLSAGINMPAKTVVISCPRKPSSTSDGGEDRCRNLTPNEFNQMAGRAGRRGIDTVGYCYYLSCNSAQRKLYENLVNTPSNKLQSNLDIDYSFICKYLSEFNSQDELEYILSKSLSTFDNKKSDTDFEKVKNLINLYNFKKSILSEFKFINNDLSLTSKGNLLMNLNGYEQIPIINSICNKDILKLSPAELAGLISGMANVEYNTIDDLGRNSQKQNIHSFELQYAKELTEKNIETYNIISAPLHPDRDIKFNTKAMTNVYHWAKLNSKNYNSKKCWKKMFSDEYRLEIKDEGSLFKEITMTADLIKQLIEQTENFKSPNNNTTEEAFYHNLAINLKEALFLIQREPANESF